jgi:hypothetical protein
MTDFNTEVFNKILNKNNNYDDNNNSDNNNNNNTQSVQSWKLVFDLRASLI